METTVLQADTRKSTSLLKKYLKERFGIKTSIRSEFYSMGCSLNISYELGVDQKEIEKVCKRLQYEGFDGMTDSSYSLDNEGLVVDGYKLEEFKYVFVKQDWSSEFNYKLAQFVSDNINYSGVPALTCKEDMNTLFPDGREFDSWNWSELIGRLLKVTNFATQDESKIILKSVSYSEKDNNALFFIYEVDGVEYNTEELPELNKKAPVAVTATAPALEVITEKKEVVAGEVEIVDYSEKAIAVIGDTKSIKDTLKELGGKFNYNLKCGAGWIFPKTKLELLVSTLNK